MGCLLVTYVDPWIDKQNNILGKDLVIIEDTGMSYSPTYTSTEKLSSAEIPTPTLIYTLYVTCYMIQWEQMNMTLMDHNLCQILFF